MTSVTGKPNPPIVKVLPTSSLLVGSDTELVCETYSTSLPQGHGLASEVFWYDQNGRQILYSGNEQRVCCCFVASFCVGVTLLEITALLKLVEVLVTDPRLPACLPQGWQNIVGQDPVPPPSVVPGSSL